jgi:2-succinyl-5-enolpyruvyl-6-hydroxy-3-cyclohexene-1-carboxylate synthase
MIPTNRTYAPIEALVDELVRCGMRHAVTCPGSRNAPIALTLAAEARLDTVSVIDERSAGFMALGMAKAAGAPVAVTCTSGTAAANLLPAVVEAHQARVPLIVLTADRPPELREVGAGQAIDQIKLYGSAAKWFVEVGTHEPGRGTAVHHRALGCRAYWTAALGVPGPVHLNMPLREPLSPQPEELEASDWQGRPDGRPWTELRGHSRVLAPADLHSLADLMGAVERGAIVCGSTSEDVTDAVPVLAAVTGWPVLAEPTSGLRCGAHDRSHVVAHYDVLLRAESFLARHRPELVLRVGDMPTSKPLRGMAGDCAQVVLDPHAAWHEPTRTAEVIVHADAAPALIALSSAIDLGAQPAPSGEWLRSWIEADALVAPALAAAPDPFEPKAHSALEPVAPEGAQLWLSSSMPVRDVEAYFPQSPKQLRFLSNRGANGIDGVASSAAGAARATGARTFLLIGEIALLHDVGGLLAARRAGVELTVLCINNGGGGIFDFLPVAGHAEAGLYEDHVATPSNLDVATVARLAGMEHRVAVTPAEVQEAAGTPGLVEVQTDRGSNVRLHREVVERVAAALGPVVS